MLLTDTLPQYGNNILMKMRLVEIIGCHVGTLFILLTYRQGFKIFTINFRIDNHFYILT